MSLHIKMACKCGFQLQEEWYSLVFLLMKKIVWNCLKWPFCYTSY